MRYSFATYEDARDKQPFPLILSTRNDQPFCNVGWQLEPDLRAVADERAARRLQQHPGDQRDATTGPASATPTPLYGIAGGQPIDGLSSIGWGSGLTAPGAIATDSDTLAKTFQINEKLTWLKGRHALKFGGQWLRYNQQRFYAGNNGLLGFINYNGAFTGFAFSDFLLDMVSSKGRGGGDPTDPWTHLQNRTALFAQDDFKIRTNLTLNLGLRWAYTSPLVEKDNRQSNFDLVTGEQIFAKDGSIEERALYKPYYKGFEPRLGAAWKPSEKLVVRGGYGISQFMEGTGANLRLPLNPPFFFESAVNYDQTTGAGSAAVGLRRTGTGDDADRQRPRLRPEPAAAVHAAVERVRRVPADRLDVGTDRLRRPPRRAPGDAGRRQPGAAGRRRSEHLGAQEHAPAALCRAAADHHHRDDRVARREPLPLAAGSVRQRMQHGLEFMASYTLAKARTNNRGFYGVFGGTGLQGVTSATEGAYWQNTYDPEAEWGPAFHDVRHNLILSGTWELPFGKGRR